MTRISLNAYVLIFSGAGPLLAQSTQAPIYASLASAHARAAQTELVGHGLEQRGEWAAALNQYRATADSEDIIPLAAPFDYLVASSAHLDAARMLSQLNQTDSAEFGVHLHKSIEAANKALSFFGLAPEYRAVAYNNLAFAQWMEGDAPAARIAFGASVATNAAPAAARDGLTAANEFLKTNRVLTAPQQKPGGMTEEQWRKVRSVGIDAGMILFRKEFPVGTSLIGLLLHAVNGQ